MEPKTIKHLKPVWREKADFIIGAEDINKTSSTKVWEQLWCRTISENSFEICCIPFFLYDLSLGDEVKTDHDYWIQKVIKPSGHLTFRVWFDKPNNEVRRKELVSQIINHGCLYEIYSNKLIAIDAPNELLASEIADYLFTKEQLGWFIYETGKT